MLLAILYLPFLVLSPILLVAAVLFCIPGGFIIVLGVAYLLGLELAGLVGRAARRRWRTTHARRMPMRHVGAWRSPRSTVDQARRLESATQTAAAQRHGRAQLQRHGLPGAEK
jgi:hypothetical protein